MTNKRIPNGHKSMTNYKTNDHIHNSNFIHHKENLALYEFPADKEHKLNMELYAFPTDKEHKLNRVLYDFPADRIHAQQGAL